MAYRCSVPLQRWLGDRRAAITMLESAHALMSPDQGGGDPLEPDHPLAHAYVLRVVAEFQAFVRDMHDLAAHVLVTSSGAHADHHELLLEAATRGRRVDRGNADVRTLQSDFRRLGLEAISLQIGAAEPRWQQSDQRSYRELIELRNALAHGNGAQLVALRARGVLDTLSWPQSRLPALDRVARAMDGVVWDCLLAETGQDPWR